jgi:hypothetical protein
VRHACFRKLRDRYVFAGKLIKGGSREQGTAFHNRGLRDGAVQVSLAMAVLRHAVMLWNQSGEMDMEFDGSGSDTRLLFGVLITTMCRGKLPQTRLRAKCPFLEFAGHALLLSLRVDSCLHLRIPCIAVGDPTACLETHDCKNCGRD